MRAMLIAALCILACGKKQVDKAVDDYLNRDMATVRAKIVASREAYGKIAADDIDQPGKRAYLSFNLGQVAAPFLAQALTETKAIKPPPPAVAFHDYTISVLSDEAPLIADMAAAVTAADAEKFKAAHARMMDLQERVIRWEDYRTKLVFSSGARLGPLPKLELPEPKPATPPPDTGSAAAGSASSASTGLCGAGPCPCKPGTEKIEGDWFEGCELTQDVEINGKHCAPGKIGFAEKRFLLSCTSAEAFDMPGNASIRCAAAEVGYNQDGSIDFCILDRELTQGSETIPKGSYAFVDENGKLKMAKRPDGKLLDFMQ